MRLQSTTVNSNSTNESSIEIKVSEEKVETVSEAPSEIDDTLERQTEFNGNILKMLEKAMKMPVDELGDLNAKLACNAINREGEAVGREVDGILEKIRKIQQSTRSSRR